MATQFNKKQEAQAQKEKKRKDYAFRRQFNEKLSIIPGCPGSSSPQVQRSRMTVLVATCMQLLA